MSETNKKIRNFVVTLMCIAALLFVFLCPLLAGEHSNSVQAVEQTTYKLPIALGEDENNLELTGEAVVFTDKELTDAIENAKTTTDNESFVNVSFACKPDVSKLYIQVPAYSTRKDISPITVKLNSDEKIDIEFGGESRYALSKASQSDPMADGTKGILLEFNAV